MRRKYKDIIKKSLAVVLAVTMLPLGDYSNVVMATEVNDTSVSSENKEKTEVKYERKRVILLRYLYIFFKIKITKNND